MDHRVVFKEPGHYASFPRVRRMRNGDLLLQHYDLPDEVQAQHPNISPHYQFGSRIRVLRSTDEGETWERSEADERPEDWQESGVSRLRRGDAYTEPDPPNWQTAAELEDGTVIHSGGGVEWARDPEQIRFPSDIAEDPVEMPDGWWCAYVKGMVARCRFANGRWHKELFPLKVPPFVRPHWGWAYPRRIPDGSLVAVMGGQHPEYRDRLPLTLFAARSVDNGLTWEAQGMISPHVFRGSVPESGDPAADRGEEEPYSWALCEEVSIALTPSGRLISAHRVEGMPGTPWWLLRHNEGFVYQAESLDYGKTWQPAHKTPMWGHPPHLLLLSDGRLVCTFGYRRHPCGIHACVSHDEGQSWDYGNVHILRSGAPTGDIGYPTSVQLKDDRIFTTYYFTVADGVRHIAGRGRGARERREEGRAVKRERARGGRGARGSGRRGRADPHRRRRI